MKQTKTGIILLLLVFILGGFCSAQSNPKESSEKAFKVIKATVQHWAGGVVGRSGVTYNIQLETNSSTMAPDTVWINGYVYPIDAFRSDGQYIKSVDSITKQITYSIMVSETHDNFNRRHLAPKTDTTQVKPKHIRTTQSGTALISYRHKKKQHFFTVGSFTQLKQLNYP